MPSLTDHIGIDGTWAWVGAAGISDMVGDVVVQ
jgi:hypothetical protein